MGELVRYQLGTMPETPESILKRIVERRDSPDFNSSQLEGKYYFAQTAPTWARRSSRCRTRSSA